MVRKSLLLVGSTVLLFALNITTASADDDSISRGRYLVKTSGCNDCHTAGYPEKGGDVPESEWLTGLPIGFRGPWGTSYAANLRRSAANMDEAQFIVRSRSQMLPPMPWFSLRDMTDDDVAAIYRYIRSLGPAGENMPAYVPPGQKASTPFIIFVPQSGE